MDDIYDLRSIFLGKDSLVHTLITDGLEGTPASRKVQRTSPFWRGLCRRKHRLFDAVFQSICHFVD